MTETPMDPPTTATTPPVVMGLGSEGPAVKPVLAFLAEQYHKKQGAPHPALIVNEQFGAVATQLMSWYQGGRGGNEADYLNLWTVRRMAEDGFNYYAAAQAAGDRVTMFVDWKGICTFWKPGHRSWSNPDWDPDSRSIRRPV